MEDLPQDSSWDVSSTTDGNHEIRLEVIENAVCCSLTQFVHLRSPFQSALVVVRILRTMDFLHDTMAGQIESIAYLVVGDVDLFHHTGIVWSLKKKNWLMRTSV